MEVVPSENFLQWAAGVGIGFDQRYPESRCLCLLPPREHTRFWTMPSDPAAWPHFIASLLGGLDEWNDGLLWPRSGRFPDPAHSQSHSDGVRGILLRGVG